MPEFDVTKDGSKINEVIDSAKKKIEEALFQGMEKALLTIEADAKRNCPVDEGRLRASITHKVESNENEVVGGVGSNVEYAPWIEMGTGIYAVNGDGRKDPWVFKDREGKFHRTVGMKPRRFLGTALDSNRDKIGQIFKEATDKLK